MELTVLDKLDRILNYLTSSFLSIGLLLIVILFFTILFLNINRNKKIVKTIASIVLFVAALSMIIVFNEYALYSMDVFIKWILHYIYFPSMAMYFMIILFVTFILISTIHNKEMTKFKKRINIGTFAVLYFMFLCVISIAVVDNIYFTNLNSIYEHDTLVSFLQISNMIFFFWIQFTLVYKLFQYFKRKYD